MSYNFNALENVSTGPNFHAVNPAYPQSHPDVVGLQLFQGSAKEFKQRRQDMMEKYANNPQMLTHIKRTRYSRFYKPAKRKIVKPICFDEIRAGQNPFVRDCWTKIQAKVHDPLQKVVDGEWGCDDDPALGAHQIVHTEVARMIAHAGTPGPNKRRGLLVYTNTGSGKTMTAMGIITSFWNSKLPIFLVTTPENAKNNPASEYAENCLLFFPNDAKTIFEDVFLPPRELWTKQAVKNNDTFVHNGRTYTVASWCDTVGAPVMAKRVKGLSMSAQDYMSFRKFGGDKTSSESGLEQMKTGAVVIVDEAQNLFKPKTKGEHEIRALRNMRNKMVKREYMENSYVFALTATPGDTATHVINLINLVRPYGMDEITVPAFVANTGIIRGLVSYADIRGDKTKYGTITGGKPIKQYAGMTPVYWTAFLLQFLTEQGKTDAIFDLNNPDHSEMSKQFFASDIKNSCILPLSTFKPLGKATKTRAGLSDKERRHMQTMTVQVQGRTQYVLSEKMRVLFENVRNIDGCQYIFVKDPMVMAACIVYLRQKQGYSIVDPNNLSRITGPKLRLLPVKDKGELTIGSTTIEFTDDNVKKAIKLFKSNANSKGELIELCIGTKFEGLDMSFLRAVHIVTPLSTTGDDEQAVGRALRLCGHTKDERDVVVYRYFSTPPTTMSEFQLTPNQKEKYTEALDTLRTYHLRGINAHVHDDAIRRGKPLKTFMKCIQGQSIECEINKANGGLLHALQASKVQCGIPRCPVDLTARNELVVPPHVQPVYTKKNENNQFVYVDNGITTIPPLPGTRMQSSNSVKSTRANTRSASVNNQRKSNTRANIMQNPARSASVNNQRRSTRATTVQNPARSASVNNQRRSTRATTVQNPARSASVNNQRRSTRANTVQSPARSVSVNQRRSNSEQEKSQSVISKFLQMMR